MSNRIYSINSLIKRELGRIFLSEVDFPAGILVTITRVETSPDLSQAKVYVSLYKLSGKKEDFEARRKEVFNILKRKIYDIQQKLNKRLQMKIVPRIKFVKEEKTESAERIERLLRKIKEEGGL